MEIDAGPIRSPYAYLTAYSMALADGLAEITPAAITAAYAAVVGCRGRIFVGGNGGSASGSEHLCCDWMKRKNLNVQSLSSNLPLITMIANDFGYEYIFSYQLERAQLTKNDLVVLISASGSSKNIVAAANFTKTTPARLLALTGFAGGKLRECADISLHIPSDNYGVVEDCHQSLMHVLAQFSEK